jgi:hypothetical protein
MRTVWIALMMSMLLLGCGRESGPEKEKPEAAGATRSTGETTRREIKLDGRADEWMDVPVALKVEDDGGRPTTYDCRAVKLTSDDTHLYILFVLGKGIGERHAEQIEKTGRATSGAIGHLHLEHPRHKFAIWVPTGFTTSYDTETDQVTNEPMMSIDVSREASDGQAMETVFEARWPEDANSVAFQGKHLELAIPLEKLGINDHKQLDVTLSEM